MTTVATQLFIADEMECVIFIGIPATGKSSFFKERFADTHVRVNLDMLRTRRRERRLIEVCFETGISFVVDNTNPAKSDRCRYVAMAKASGCPVTGYYFSSRLEDALRRNSQRPANSRIPDAGVLAGAGRLELPSLDEGFNELYYVALSPEGFNVSPCLSSKREQA